LGVFSFGTLVVAPGTVLKQLSRSNYLIALVAAHRIEVQGRIQPGRGFSRGVGIPELHESGPAPGGLVSDEQTAGFSGAGAATAGGLGGGPNGPPGGPALLPQFEPLCPGSGGGGDIYSNDSVPYESGGPGGGAMMLVAGDSITIGGADGCGVFANGGPG